VLELSSEHKLAEAAYLDSPLTRELGTIRDEVEGLWVSKLRSG
jgi:hypothetical protein